MWLYTEPRHKAANGQVVPRGDTQSPHPGEHPGPTTQTLGKGNSLVSGSCPWRALESERLACLLNGQRHWLPGPPSPAGRSSLLLPQLRAWRSYLRRPCCLSGCSQLHLPRFRGHPCHASPPCSLSHPLPPRECHSYSPSSSSLNTSHVPGRHTAKVHQKVSPSHAHRHAHSFSAETRSRPRRARTQQTQD